MIEDGAAILRSHVRTLPVHLRGIMQAPESLNQLIVTDLRRIEMDLDHFSMACSIGADVLVSRIAQVSALIAGRDILNSFHFPKRCFDSPKAACAKSRF